MFGFILGFINAKTQAITRRQSAGVLQRERCLQETLDVAQRRALLLRAAESHMLKCCCCYQNNLHIFKARLSTITSAQRT